MAQRGEQIRQPFCGACGSFVRSNTLRAQVAPGSFGPSLGKVTADCSRCGRGVEAQIHLGWCWEDFELIEEHGTQNEESAQ